MSNELSKNGHGCASHNHDPHGIQRFDGFPYFVTRIVPALYDVILLPAEMNEASLIGYSEHQACSNKLDACLVLSENRGLWFTPEGGAVVFIAYPVGRYFDNRQLEDLQGILYIR